MSDMIQMNLYYYTKFISILFRLALKLIKTADNDIEKSISW